MEISGSAFASADSHVTFIAAVTGNLGSRSLSWAAAGPNGFTATAGTDEFVLTPPAGGTYTIAVTVTSAGDTLTDTATLTVLGDIAGHHFADQIVWLAEQGITSGCSASEFCPAKPVTRAQMAAFLSRALNLPQTPIDNFNDDDGSVHQHDINRLASSGITSGCTPSQFCPAKPVTRAQMAAFLSRALNLPQTPIDNFNDDDGSVHQHDINRLASSGITSGCTPSQFCPAKPVTRAQMAAFLHRARHLIAAARTP